MIKNLVLSGGALKGFSFIGVIEYLEDNNLLSNLETLVGSSAGSLICFLLCLNLTSLQIKKNCTVLLNSYLQEPIDLNLIFNLNQSLGIDNGHIIIDLLKELCLEHFKADRITFFEFVKKTGYNLVVCASNLTTREPTYFCVDNSPHVNVLDAIRASITIPFIFTPIVIDKQIYVDAGIFNHFPINFIKTFVLQDTLGIIIKCNPYTPPKPLTFISYFRLLIDSMLERINIKDDILKNFNVIEIDCGNEDIFDFDFNTMKMTIDKHKVEEYIIKGYSSILSSAVKEKIKKGFLLFKDNEEQQHFYENDVIKKDDLSLLQVPLLYSHYDFHFNRRLWDIFIVRDHNEILN